MYEESAFFTLLGVPVYWYGVMILLGAAALLAVFALGGRGRVKPGTVPLFGVLAAPITLICSRLLFCLLDFRFHDMFSLRAVCAFWGGGYSMVGALLGLALAAWLTARITKQDAVALLDLLFPALCAFICFARVGEGFTELLGRSRSLTQDLLGNSFLASNDGYDAYLNTYVLEAATAAILGVITWLYGRRGPRRGNVLLTGMLLLGCTQVLWESLRFDSHMRYSFISMQQILFACMFALPLVIYAARCGKKAMISAILLCAVVVGGAVGLEFMIDRSDVSNVICYILYILLLALPAAAGLYFRQRSERN